MPSSNEHLPLIVVTRTKPSRDAGIGVLLKMEHSLLIISGINEGGLFDKTKLGVGMNLISINGIPVATSQDAVKQIQASESDVTIAARWFVGSLVSCTVVKPNKSATLGVVLKKQKESGIFVVSKIVESSLFEATPLQTGMVVRSINGKNITEMTKEEVADLMKQAEGTLTIDAKVPGRGPPPNAPHGGMWLKENFRGATSTCGTIIGCLLFGIPGLICLAIPCDEREVYVANGSVYAVDGSVMREST